MDANTRDLLSVGIDIGTTTSQLVLSQFSVSNQARAGLVPRLDVDARTVLYQSEPRLTPLLAPDEINVGELLSMIRLEYERAGIDASQVETGAVIITGETARTKNAEAILQGLSDLAGDFVVTVAGPNLESQIAGRGSGASEWSAEHYATIVNVDVGGGSANAAVFRAGKHVASAAVMVGGRQAIVNPDTGILEHLKPGGQVVVESLGLTQLQVGKPAPVAELRKFTDAMADVVVDLVLGQSSPLWEKLALTPPMNLDGPVAAYFVSGGVGAAYYADLPCGTIQEIARYGDVGPLFAQSLRENPRWQQLRIEEPAQTLRATVLGAASQQVTLSGSTIWSQREYLPLKNLPVIEPRRGGARLPRPRGGAAGRHPGRAALGPGRSRARQFRDHPRPARAHGVCAGHRHRHGDGRLRQRLPAARQAVGIGHGGGLRPGARADHQSPQP